MLRFEKNFNEFDFHKYMYDPWTHLFVHFIGFIIEFKITKTVISMLQST